METAGASRAVRFAHGHTTYASCANDDATKEHRLFRCSWKFRDGPDVEPRVIVLETWPCADCPEILTMRLHDLPHGRQEIIPDTFVPHCVKNTEASPMVRRRSKRILSEAAPSTEANEGHDAGRCRAHTHKSSTDAIKQQAHKSGAKAKRPSAASRKKRPASTAKRQGSRGAVDATLDLALRPAAQGHENNDLASPGNHRHNYHLDDFASSPPSKPRRGANASMNHGKHATSAASVALQRQLSAVRREYKRTAQRVVEARIELIDINERILQRNDERDLLTEDADKSESTTHTRSGCGQRQRLGLGDLKQRPTEETLGRQREALVDLMLRSESLPLFSQTLDALGAQLVTVNGDGACFYRALLACLWWILFEASAFDDATNHRVWALLQGVNRTLIEQLPSMLATNSVTVKQLHERYLGTGTPNDLEAMDKVLRFLTQTLQWPVGQRLPRRRWAGAEEVMAAVLYLEEPIFIFDIAKATGTVTGAQLFHVDTQRRGARQQVVKIQRLSTDEAVQLITECRNADKVPIVLAFDHANDDSGHFDCVRFDDAVYTKARCEIRPCMAAMSESVRALQQARW